MKKDYQFQFDSPRVTGRRQQKTICPQCGRKSLVRYVDTRNGNCYLNDYVGRCDHEHSCGYHYKPQDYFNDHPWMSEVRTPNPACVLTPSSEPSPQVLKPLSMTLVEESHSPQSTFWQWYTLHCASQLGFSPDMVSRIYEDYRIGIADRGNVIFWQIDEQQRVRTGHVMEYYNGHRQGYPGWVHDLLKKNKMRGQLPDGYQLQQCFFGQHLLPQRPDAIVCIVESEKTALVMAAHCPEHLWLATCGSSGLNADKLECLRGRRFTLFPDSGCFGKWQNVMQQTSGLQYNIDDSMEAYPPNTDLADLLLHCVTPDHKDEKNHTLPP